MSPALSSDRQSRDPWPRHHRVFFSIVEPGMTVPAAIWSSIYPGPKHFHAALLPPSFGLVPIPSFFPIPTATSMAVRQLGSCYGLAALVAMLVLRALERNLHRPERFEEMRAILRAYLLALGIADLTHIAYTVVDLGLDNALDFRSYNSLVFGNTGVVVVLFLWRCWWYLECGREDAEAKEGSPGVQRRKAA